MRPILSPLLALILFASLLLFATVSWAQDAPAMDAGVGLTVSTPATKLPAPPDVIESPRAGIDYVGDIYGRSGLWVAAGSALWMLLHSIGKKRGPNSPIGAFLGNGRAAAAVASGGALVGAIMDAVILKQPGGWLVVIQVGMVAAAAIISPHGAHVGTISAASLGGGKGAGQS